MMIYSTIKKNITQFAILIFIILYGGIVISNSPFIFNPDGTLKLFGIGFTTRSVLPAWLLSVIFAIISYFIIIYYVSYPTIQF
uniref:Uncharacterized protein n=1 Tax=viral metagenome TaxID=1070528 RepID=A0A6C0JU54_9ZZZZ